MKLKKTFSKGTPYTKNNALKLFVGVFVSVMSIFALVYFVQNPLFEVKSEAKSYTFENPATIRLGKNNSGKCNSAINRYRLVFTYKGTGGWIVQRSFDYTASQLTDGKVLALSAVGQSGAATVSLTAVEYKQDGSVYRTKTSSIAGVTRGTKAINVPIDCR